MIKHFFRLFPLLCGGLGRGYSVIPVSSFKKKLSGGMMIAPIMFSLNTNEIRRIIIKI
jgi:hypothetical protein